MIFPDWNTKETKTAPLPLAREWAVDWETGELKRRDGEPYTVTGDEAVKIWVKLALDAKCVRDEKLSKKEYDCFGVSFATFNGKRVYGFMSVPTDLTQKSRKAATVMPSWPPSSNRSSSSGRVVP